MDNQINRFVVMCIEQYASSMNISSRMAYLGMKRNSVIKELEDNYEDLHGMSIEYLTDYIKSLVDNEVK